MVALENIDLDRIIEGLLAIAPKVEIAHHIPGRIRLKIMLSGLGAIKGVDLNGIVGAIPGIFNYRINAFARSAVIKYDQEQLPYDLWESIVEAGNGSEITAEVEDRLRILFNEFTLTLHKI